MTPHSALPTTPPAGLSASFAASLRARLPQLQGDRLILRAPRTDDFDSYAEVTMSPRWPQSSRAKSRTDAWYDFCNYVACWLLLGTGLWTVTLKPDDTAIGFILIGLEPGDQEPELGWLLTQSSEGQGFATEAAQLARSYALDQLNLASLVSYIDPENTRSIRLAERLGAQRDTTAEAAFDEPIQVFRHAPQGASA